MNILITDSWIREFLKTNAKPDKFAEMLSLCGPSIERVHKIKNDYLYDIEITTNRIDTASVMGIAREAAAILPQFKISAKLNLPKTKKLKIGKCPIEIITDEKLNKRVMAVVLENISVKASPAIIKNRLENAGIRSLNNIVDITNYIMMETGHPTHVFDFDKVNSSKLKFRLSKKGEKITTLDGKVYTLNGGDIVVTDEKDVIIDLPGIMGGKSSSVDKDTKKIIFFINNNDPHILRKTSLNLGIRTQAVILNEKAVDPDLAEIAMSRGIDLFQSLANGKITGQIFDYYPKQKSASKIKITHQFIEKLIGTQIPQNQVIQILTTLGFLVTHSKTQYSIEPPSWRKEDITIPEDIVEEIARIYGYHNIPSVLMTGSLPNIQSNEKFLFEKKIKNILVALGGIEVYNLSLVSKELSESQHAVSLLNPLGEDTKYLRTTLKGTLLESLKTNSGVEEPLNLFEMANVYLPQKGNLPKEKMVIAGIISKFNFRDAKGIVETLLSKINVSYHIKSKGNASLSFLAGNEIIGEFEKAGENVWYWEFSVEKLFSNSNPIKKFHPIPKYPAQIEDITFTTQKNIHIGELISDALTYSKEIVSFELRDVFKNNFTFRIKFQNKEKTLTDREVEHLRNSLIKHLGKKFEVIVKN